MEFFVLCTKRQDRGVKNIIEHRCPAGTVEFVGDSYLTKLGLKIQSANRTKVWTRTQKGPYVAVKPLKLPETSERKYQK